MILFCLSNAATNDDCDDSSSQISDYSQHSDISQISALTEYGPGYNVPPSSQVCLIVLLFC